jgi:hypothetical protein
MHVRQRGAEPKETLLIIITCVADKPRRRMQFGVSVRTRISLLHTPPDGAISYSTEHVPRDMRIGHKGLYCVGSVWE